jgi:hypothetical protein
MEASMSRALITIFAVFSLMSGVVAAGKPQDAEKE